MQMKILIWSLWLTFISPPLLAQYSQEDTTYKRHFVGSILFLLGNLDSKNSLGFIQLNPGYSL